ncbi:MAG: hypothetical protein JWQ04_2267 [Pedosphaera sp.]|nr:hypothetical protein [Pedosphaera sp.]
MSDRPIVRNMRKLFALPFALLLLASPLLAVTPSPSDKPAADVPPAVKAPAENPPAATNYPLAAPTHMVVQAAEKLLPDDTLVLFTIPDFNKAREIYQHSPQGQLWNDPAMKEFKDKFFSKFTEGYLTPLEHSLGVRFEDYTNLPQGQLTFAMVQNGWQAKEGQSPGLILLLDTRDKGAQLKTNLDDLKKKWVSAGKTVRTQRIRDVDFSVIAPTKADLATGPKKPPAPLGPGLPPPMESPEPKDAPKKEIYIGQADSLLIVGNSDKVIEKILVRLSGGSVNVLGDLADFDANRALFHDAPLYGWVNSKTLVDIFSRASTTTDAEAEVNPFAFQTDKILAGLGLNTLKAVSFNCRFSDEGSEFNVALSAPEASRAGLLKLLTGEAKEVSPPSFVPADAVKFQRWRLDGQKSWATIRKSVGDIIPTALGALDFVLNSVETAAKEKDPAFDINKALFGNLGDDIITYQKNPRGAAPEELNSPPSIFLMSSPNPEQLANALKNVFALYAQQAGAPTERELLGHKIYSIALPSAPATPNAPPAPARSLSYTCSGGYMAISTDPAMLEEYLRSTESQAKTLREAPGLTDAMQKVGGTGTSLFGYSNESEGMRVNFETMKKDPASADPLNGFAPIILAMGFGDLNSKDWFDVSLLPPFEKVSKYFYFTVYGGSSTADSINFKAFAPTPPQLKK